MGAADPPLGGIRLEVPVALRSDFRLLENVAFRIRKKTAGTKTNIKFRDEEMRMVLDFKSPNAEWRTVTPECARTIKAGNMDSIDNQTLAGLVGS